MRNFKPLILGLIIGIAAVGINISSLGPQIEENFGLDLLFRLRGVRQPPSDVVVTAIDKEAADALSLPEDPRKWPRSLHGRLLDRLYSRGAAVVAFDVVFAERRSLREDSLFAEALRKGRNTVLCEYMKVEDAAVGENRGLRQGEVKIAKVSAPIETLQRSAAASAPFPIPKSPNKVTQFWTFAAAAADKPTLPIAAFQIYALQAYGDFLDLMRKISPAEAERLPRNENEILGNRGIERLIYDIKRIFHDDPSIAERMHKELRNSKSLAPDADKRRLINSMISLYAGNTNSRYLNFYGPPRTITTVPYHRMLNLGRDSDGNADVSDIRGKAVFVGLSQLSPIDQKESFYTVYSQPQGLDLSGIEIVATAFANLEENMPVQPLDFRAYLALVFFGGGVCGFICKRFSTALSFYIMSGIVTAYLIFTVFEFKNYGIWYPVIVPVFLSPICSLFCGLLWNHMEVKRERLNIRKALGFYLPDEVADRLACNIEDIHSTHQLVFGICLSTDAEQYSSLAEVMDPENLGSFMNKYYEAIFGPIKQQGGIISDVVGDSVLAVWVAPHPENELKQKACIAALGISEAIRKFNEGPGGFKLPTRIGLHSGGIVIGNVGAIDHYEYRPVGDIVNTATRIEGLCKYLNTGILATKEVIGYLDGLVTRKIGEFKLAGKTKPVVIHELVCRLEEADEKLMKACTVFAAALDSFIMQSWDEAIKGFEEVIEILGGDGPSEFYIKLCKQNKELGPVKPWDGVISMEYK